MDLWALILSRAVTMSSIWTHLVFRKPSRLLNHSMIWDGRVGGGSNFTKETEAHNCCYITCLESLNQLLEVLDLNPGMILGLMLLPIHHADSIHNCQSVYLHNCHIKTDALPTYFRGVKHILMGFFSLPQWNSQFYSFLWFLNRFLEMSCYLKSIEKNWA